jgi:hypothetical protein
MVVFAIIWAPPLASFLPAEDSSCRSGDPRTFSAQPWESWHGFRGIWIGVLIAVRFPFPDRASITSPHFRVSADRKRILFVELHLGSIALYPDYAFLVQRQRQ